MPPAGRPPSIKQASSFQTRTATGDGEPVPDQQPTESHPKLQDSCPQAPGASDAPNPYDPATNDTVPSPRRHSFTRKLFHLHDGANDFEAPSHVRRRSASGHRKSRAAHDTEEPALIPRLHNGSERRKGGAETPTPRPGLGPRPVGGHHKLGTFSGVFVPTCLNVLSILMFLRFGFILGQGGVLGIMGSSRVR
jgi:solute carrier family 12 (potassium/chloride transporters), member 9